MTTLDVQPFRVDVPEDQLADLRDRILRTRWPDELPGVGWDYGVPLGYLRELATYWSDAYDWRAAERRFNQWPQFMTNVDGADVHFFHIRSPEPTAMPLLLLHGWPGSVVEFLQVLGPLTDPAAHGGDPADAFHVVCPSLPGYGFSGPTQEAGWHPRRMAEAMLTLMAGLGYDTFGAHGTDWGSRIVRDMGVLDPAAVRAVHTALLRTPPPPDLDLSVLTADEIDRLGDFERFNREMSGYMHIQGTRPQTLAYGLTDSPVGQLAWIVEKFKEWADAKNVPEDAVDRDLILTNVTLYWLTGTANSSSRLYYEMTHWAGNDRPDPRVNWNTPDRSIVPTGVAVSPRELFRSIRRFGEQTDNIVHWTEYERGGHFSGMEVPDLLVDDLQTFFRGVPVTADESSLLDRFAGRLPASSAAVVTGAGDTDDEETGIGAAIATVLGAAGAPVLVLDRDERAAARTTDRIAELGGRARAFIGDVRSTTDCDAAATAAAEAFGGIGILVNNAAVLGAALTVDYRDEDLATTLDINLVGSLRMARACRPHLGTGSSIINIGSLGALRTFGRLDYEAAKGALLTVTNTLAVELGPAGIRVNAVTPGQVWTPLGKRRLVEMGQDPEEIAASRRARALGCPLRIEGSAWDVASAVLFLASAEARWITAHSLVVDGGQSALVGWMPDPPA